MPVMGTYFLMISWKASCIFSIWSTISKSYERDNKVSIMSSTVKVDQFFGDHYYNWKNPSFSELFYFENHKAITRYFFSVRSQLREIVSVTYTFHTPNLSHNYGLLRILYLSSTFLNHSLSLYFSSHECWLFSTWI